MAKASRFPSLAVLHRVVKVANVDDTVRNYEHLIHHTIDQLEKLDFYQQHRVTKASNGLKLLSGCPSVTIGVAGASRMLQV